MICFKAKERLPHKSVLFIPSKQANLNYMIQLHQISLNEHAVLQTFVIIKNMGHKKWKYKGTLTLIGTFYYRMSMLTAGFLLARQVLSTPSTIY